MSGIEYGPDRRMTHPFGEGRYYQITPGLRSHQQIVDMVLRLGWSNGCPIARELTGPDSPYGVDWMMRRYADTNYWFRQAVLRAWKNNKAVFDLLFRPRMRLLGEPVGKHESLSVPKSHLWRISPMSALEGYATPRVLIEVRGESENAIHRGAEPERVLHYIYPKGILEEENCYTIYQNQVKSLQEKASTVWRVLRDLPQSQREELAIAEISS